MSEIQNNQAQKSPYYTSRTTLTEQTRVDGGSSSTFVVYLPPSIYHFIQLIKDWLFSWRGYIPLLQSKHHYEEAFYQRLLEGNYDEALRLAQTYDFLSTDLVFKCKWKNGALTSHTIRSVLGQIQDKLWSIDECLHIIPTTYDLTKMLLDFGLSQANLRLLHYLGNEDAQDIKKKHSLLPATMPDEDVEGLIDFTSLNDQQKDLCRFRKELRKHSQTLSLYRHILGSSATSQFDPGVYAELRRKSLLEIAIDYAHDSDSHAITALFNHSPEIMAEHHLPILSNFPETTPPMQYRDLLPSCRDQEMNRWKYDSTTSDSDWSDRISFTFENETDFAEEFYKLHPHLVCYRELLTERLLSQWYVQRAYEIEEKTLLVSNALQLLSIGKCLEVPNLSNAHDEFEEFYKVIYDCCADDNIDISLSQFKHMEHMDRLLLIVGNSSQQSKERFSFNIIPYIQRREAELGTVGKMKLIKDFFIKLAQRDQQLCWAMHKALVDSIEGDYIVAKWTRDLGTLVEDIASDIKRIEEEKKIRSISKMAQSMYDLRDYNNCYEACQVIMSKNYHQCWNICAKLGLNPEFDDTRGRIKLLSFALAHCNDENGKDMVKLLTDIVNLRKNRW